jgi:hypothetical protein
MRAFVTRSPSAFERAAVAAGCLLAALAAVRIAAAQPAPQAPSAPSSADKTTCFRAYEQAQRLRKANKLVAAQEQLATCKVACPAGLRVDCDQWQADNDARIATLSISASDADGRAVTDVRVIVDDELRVTRLGAPLGVDPGDHVLRFERDSSKAVAQQVSVHDGERNRAIAVRFEPVPGLSPAAPAAIGAPRGTQPARGPSAAVYASGAVGVLGLVGLTYFGIRRANDVDTLDRCKPSCAVSDVQAANLELYLAGGSLLVALAGAGLAAYFYVKDSASQGTMHSGLLVVSPQAGGLAATLRGSF